MIRNWKSFSCKYCYFDFSRRTPEKRSHNLLILKELSWMYELAPLATTFCHGIKTKAEEQLFLRQACEKIRYAEMLLFSQAKEAQFAFLENPRISFIRDRFKIYMRQNNQRNKKKPPNNQKSASAENSAGLRPGEKELLLKRKNAPVVQSDQGGINAMIYKIQQHDYDFIVMPPGTTETDAINALKQALKKVHGLTLVRIGPGAIELISPE